MAAVDFQDFELSIDLREDGDIGITVVQSPSGTATAIVHNPFTNDEVLRMLGMLDDSANASPAEEARSARQFGEKLFRAIFTGDIATTYNHSIQQAGEGGLRLRLNLEKAGELLHLPWELLRDPRGEVVALSRNITIVRGGQYPAPRSAVEYSLPFRILVMIATPTDQPTLNATEEWQALMDATADLRERGLVVVDRVESGQMGALQRKLREGKAYQAFHFIGHAIDEEGHSGLLAFEDPRKRVSLPVAADDLVRELAVENSVRLVVLGSGQSSQREDVRDPFERVSEALMSKGMSAVIELQFGMTDEGSKLFAADLYRLLAEGYAMETAMNEVRRGLQRSAGSLEWVSPSLHLNPQAGLLFPKRRAYDGRVSLGGLRERAVLLAFPVIVVIIGLLAGVYFVARSIFEPSVTPGPKVDLSVVDMFVFPPNPAPGEPVSVTFQIRNNSQQDSGKFQWSWFVGDPGDTPALEDSVDTLKAGTTLVVKREFPFGGWGNFLTVVFVNDKRFVQDDNTTNDVKTRLVTTDVKKPFAIDFQFLPNGKEINETTNLQGDEFDVWNLKFVPMIEEGDTECKDAVVKISVDDLAEVRRLITGLPGQLGQCKSLPIRITFGKPMGNLESNAAEIEFVPTVAGTYNLTLTKADGTSIITSSELTVKQADVDSSKPQRISVKVQEVTLTDTTLIFTPPIEAITNLSRLTLTPKIVTPTVTP